ncbi:MAG: hypothetical protein AB2792_02355 [Candidatus Thiodiazotropha sp.]
MENDPRKRRKLSDHALELIMRDVLHGLQEFSLEMQTDPAPAMASTEEHRLASGSVESTLRSKKR